MSQAPVSATQISALLEQLAQLETTQVLPEQPVVAPLPPPVITHVAPKAKTAFLPLFTAALVGGFMTWLLLPTVETQMVEREPIAEIISSGFDEDLLDPSSRVLAKAVRNLETRLLQDFSSAPLSELKEKAQASTQACRAQLLELYANLSDSSDRERLASLVQASRLQGLMPKQLSAEPRPLYLCSEAFTIDFSFLAKIS